MLGLIVAIPAIALFSMLCTSPAWIAGLIRGNRELPRMTASWFTRTPVRIWIVWFLASTIGMMTLGAALNFGREDLGALLWTFAALPFFAVAQFLAFRLGYLVGDARLRRRITRGRQANAFAHAQWQGAQASPAPIEGWTQPNDHAQQLPR